MLLYAMFETKQGTGQAEVLSEQQLHVAVMEELISSAITQQSTLTGTL